MKTNDAIDVVDAVTVLSGGFLGTVGLVCAVVLGIAALLMPIYVLAMNEKMKRMMWLMERQLEELRKIRERWDA